MRRKRLGFFGLAPKKKVLKKSKNKNYGTIFTLWHPQKHFYIVLVMLKPSLSPEDVFVTKIWYDDSL